MSVPVTILSGFLGSGKTTLLNRLLADPGGRRLGVIVNDFGQVAVDGLLAGAEQDLVELAGGCVCCRLRDDLVVAVERVLAGGVDHLIIETTGLADPYPVAEAIRSSSLAGRARLDAVVTVVDAENHRANRELDPVADDQVRCADLLLLNKVDLVPPAEADALAGELTRLNRRCSLLRTVHAAVPPAAILDPRLEGTLSGAGAGATCGTGSERDADVVCGAGAEPGHPRGSAEHPRETAGHAPAASGRQSGGHAHRGKITSFGLARRAALNAQAFEAFLRSLPPGVIRAKGVIWLAGERRRLVLHQVGRRRTVDFDGEWPPGAAETRLLVIGQDLDGERLAADLERCVTEAIEPAALAGSADPTAPAAPAAFVDPVAPAPSATGEGGRP